MLKFLKKSTRPVGVICIVSNSKDAVHETYHRFAKAVNLGGDSTTVTAFYGGFESWAFDHDRGLDSFLASV